MSGKQVPVQHKEGRLKLHKELRLDHQLRWILGCDGPVLVVGQDSLAKSQGPLEEEIIADVLSKKQPCVVKVIRRFQRAGSVQKAPFQDFRLHREQIEVEVLLNSVFKGSQQEAGADVRGEGKRGVCTSAVGVVRGNRQGGTD